MDRTPQGADADGQRVAAFFYSANGDISPYVLAVVRRELDPGILRHDGLYFTEETVEDVVQEALVRALKATRRGAIKSNPEGYWLAILRNTIADQLRGAKRETELDAPFAGEDEAQSLLDLLEAEPGAWEHLREGLLLVLAGQLLSGKLLEAAQLYIVFDFDATATRRAIVERDGCTAGTARERLSAMRKALRAALSGDEELIPRLDSKTGRENPRRGAA
jgi:DNA-directed RNA polymerase specialized sigma24 family protein